MVAGGGRIQPILRRRCSVPSSQPQQLPTRTPVRSLLSPHQGRQRGPGANICRGGPQPPTEDLWRIETPAPRRPEAPRRLEPSVPVHLPGSHLLSVPLPKSFLALPGSRPR